MNTDSDATNTNQAVQEEDGAKALEEDFKSLETELARQKDLYLRLAADFDNFRLDRAFRPPSRKVPLAVR